MHTAELHSGVSLSLSTHSSFPSPPSPLLLSQVILTEIYSTGFQRSFSDDDDLTSIADSDVIYAFQAPPLYSRGGSARFSGNRGNGIQMHPSCLAGRSVAAAGTGSTDAANDCFTQTLQGTLVEFVYVFVVGGFCLFV